MGRAVSAREKGSAMDPIVKVGAQESGVGAGTFGAGMRFDVDSGGGQASPALMVRDLFVRFSGRGRTVYAVNGVSLTVERGRTIALIGESGCGKSTTARAVMGLLPKSAVVTGSVRLDGEELIGLTERHMRRYRGRQVAMVFQDPSRALNPTMRIGSLVAEAVRYGCGADSGTARGTALELLDRVRLPSPRRCFSQYPHELSGGMQQRAMIAIALAGNPSVLMADEATSGLDVTTQAQVMNLLRELQVELGMALVLISHDIGLATCYADETMVMYAGEGVERASGQELFSNPRMPYSRALVQAIPDVEDMPGTDIGVVGGRPPELDRPPVGCPFAPRCNRVREECWGEQPPFEEHTPAHWFACWNPWPEQ